MILPPNGSKWQNGLRYPTFWSLDGPVTASDVWVRVQIFNFLHLNNFCFNDLAPKWLQVAERA